MLPNKNEKIDKDKLETYLRDFSKTLRKQCGKEVSVNLYIVGGASILLNYDFRNTTIDVDAVIRTNASIKDAIKSVANKYDLPNNWLNSDFEKTSSFSNGLIKHSTFLRTFSNIVHIHTIKDEYLLAMKVKACRIYKNDLSDIIGIIQSNKNLTFDDIDKAYFDLYNREIDNKELVTFLKSMFSMDSQALKTTYSFIQQYEEINAQRLRQFGSEYKNILSDINANLINKTFNIKPDLAFALEVGNDIKNLYDEKKTQTPFQNFFIEYLMNIGYHKQEAQRIYDLYANHPID